MREVGFPQDSLDADKVAHFDSDRLEPEVDIYLPAEDFARSERNAFLPESACFPLRVARFQNRADPTQAGFGENPHESGKPFECPGKNQERYDLRGRAEITECR